MLLAALTASAASAQTAPAAGPTTPASTGEAPLKLEAFQVTGSNIKRLEMEAARLWAQLSYLVPADRAAVSPKP